MPAVTEAIVEKTDQWVRAWEGGGLSSADPDVSLEAVGRLGEVRGAGFSDHC